MPQIDPNKWIGIDPINLLLGGKSNKLEEVGKQINNIASFIEQVNALNEIIATGIDTANAILQADLEKLLKINPLKEAAETLINEAKEVITDVKGTGVYFLDMNTTVPPMFHFGLTFIEQQIQREINVVEARKTELEALGAARSSEEERELVVAGKEAIRLKEKKANVRAGGMGGTAKYMRTFNESLDDELDFNRPIFTDNAAIAALFIMFGSSSLNDFFKLWENLLSLIKNIKPLSADVYPPLERLTAKYVAPMEYDSVYVQQRTYLELAQQAFDRSPQLQKEYSDYSEVDGALVIRNKENNEIEEIRPIILNPSLMDGRAGPKYLMVHFGATNDEYLNGRSLTLVLDKVRVAEDKSMDPDGVYLDRGNVWYNSEGSYGWDVTLFDSEASESTEGNVYLYWYYPKQSNILTKFFKGTVHSWEDIYILKKTLTRDDPFLDLETYVGLGIPPKEDEHFSVTPVSSLKGLRKSYLDNVVKIDEAFDENILGYEYAVVAGYTIRERITIASTNSEENVFVTYPLRTCVFDPKSSSNATLLERLQAERDDALQELEDAGHDDIVQELLAKGDIGISRASLSNIATVVIPTDYDLSQSVPPDWKTFPHLTMMMPKLFNILENVVTVLDTIVNYVKDALDFLPELGEALKNEVAYYLKKITQIANAISDILRTLAALQTGIYMMPVQLSSGGLTKLKKVLAMSLTGNLEEVPWKDSHPNAYLQLQAGPPPFSSDDYIGGYVLLGGAPEFLLNLIEGVSDGSLTDLFNELVEEAADVVSDSYASGYSNINSAAEQAKIDGGPGDAGVVPVPADLEGAETYARLSDALDQLESGNTGAVAGHLSNAIECSQAYANVGSFGTNLKNYDGSEITNPGLLAFLDALAPCNTIKMGYAAEVLRNSNARFPNDPTLFSNAEDATSYNTWKLMLSQAMAEQMTSITMNEGLRDVEVSVNPFDNVGLASGAYEYDEYQIGWNIAVHDSWDTRRLISQVHNDQWQAVSLVSDWEIEGTWDDYTSEVHNDSWEIMLYENV